MFNEDDDEQYYRETVYNEDYYLEKEEEMIGESNLELELERLEDEVISEMREAGLLMPALVKSGENISETNLPEPTNSSDDPGDLPF
jgi:hypothetical protein